MLQLTTPPAGPDRTAWDPINLNISTYINQYYIKNYTYTYSLWTNITCSFKSLTVKNKTGWYVRVTILSLSIGSL